MLAASSTLFDGFDLKYPVGAYPRGLNNVGVPPEDRVGYATLEGQV